MSEVKSKLPIAGTVTNEYKRQKHIHRETHMADVQYAKLCMGDQRHTIAPTTEFQEQQLLCFETRLQQSYCR
jgi:hypothetical protein